MPPAFEQQVTFLYTDDLAKSAQFYGEVLGLPLWLDQGTCRIYRVASGGLIGVCQTGSGEAQRTDKHANVIVTLVTEDVDGWFAHLRARGVTFEKPPSINERYQIYNCFFRDPNGYLLEIQRFLNAPGESSGS
jgi:catechol 2,3-dioxygenase-like lactoylglutathione lyase family enzyme